MMLYKNVLFLICILFVFCSLNILKKDNNNNNNNNFKKDEDEILWSSKRKLVWNDFKGNPDSSKTNVDAITSFKIEITEDYMLDGIPKYVLQCYFVKSKSWTRVSDESTLLHEQLHFDIAELFTRKIRKAFDSLNVKKVKDYQVYNNIYGLYGKKNEVYQNLYDYEVYFNESQQQKWIKKIDVELRRLEKYQFVVDK